MVFHGLMEEHRPDHPLADHGGSHDGSHDGCPEPLAAALARNLDPAFERLVRGEIDRLFSIACRLLADERDAEEVAQDALVRAYRALAGFEPSRIEQLAVRPWLAAIVVNLARNRRRRTRTARRGGTPAPHPDQGRATLLPAPRAVPPGATTPDPVDDDPVASPETVVLRREASAGWAALLAELPARYRLPLVLRYVGDLSTPEVAAALGRPEGTVKAQLHRGLRRLRAAYLATLAAQDPAPAGRAATAATNEETR